MIVEIVVGVLLGGAFVVYAHRQRGRGEARTYAAGLVVAALVYVGFALVRGAGLRWTALEVAGLLPFLGFSWLGLRRNPLWLAVGWVAHVGWDVGIHLPSGAPVFVPRWYPLVCIGFDLIVAVAILRYQPRADEQPHRSGPPPKGPVDACDRGGPA